MLGPVISMYWGETKSFSKFDMKSVEHFTLIAGKTLTSKRLSFVPDELDKTCFRRLAVLKVKTVQWRAGGDVLCVPVTCRLDTT